MSSLTGLRKRHEKMLMLGRRWVGVVVVSMIATLSGCGGDGSSEFLSVSETVIQSDGGPEMSVWSPDTGGGWPVAYVLHGLGNDRGDMAGFATALAREGLVVFVPDIRTDEVVASATDVECGYAVALERAEEFGGDPDRPVAMVGWSFGAVTAS
jgi:hypothetical protein